MMHFGVRLCVLHCSALCMLRVSSSFLIYHLFTHMKELLPLEIVLHEIQ